MKKRWLRNEWRQNWKVGQRREVGRTPNWVYKERKEQERKDDETDDA